MDSGGRSKQRFLFSLGVFSIYCLLRFIIYHYFPVTDVDSWIKRDALMNLPRLICLSLLLIFVIDKKGELLPNKQGVKVAMVALPVLVMPLFVRSLFFETRVFSDESLFIVLISSFVVGFFEETLFRGSIFDSLANSFSNRDSVLVSSVLFTIFHFQSQSIIDFPQIFLLGIIFAILRLYKVSLFWLAILHSVFDCIVLFWSPSEQMKLEWSSYELIFYIFVAAIYWWRLPAMRLKSFDRNQKRGFQE